MIAWMACAAAVVVLATVAANIYLKRSQRSLKAASRTWVDVSALAHDIVSDKTIPAVVANHAILLASATGCGCFVRGMLLGHYFGAAVARPKTIAGERYVSELSEARSRLDPEKRGRLDDLVMRAIVYDSFANPLQGWLFRRVLAKRVSQSEQLFEARQVVPSVVARRRPPARELCSVS